MGVSADKRAAADRARRVKPRRTGQTQSGYLTVALTVPSPIVRDVAGTESATEAWEYWRAYEFAVELTKEGLLYRPTRLREEEGW